MDLKVENKAEIYRKMQAAWEKVLHELNAPEHVVKLLLWGIANRLEHLGQQGAVVCYFEECGVISLQFWAGSKLHELELNPTKQAELEAAVADYNVGSQVVCLAVWDIPDPNLRWVDVLTVTMPNVKNSHL
jgi:hypothetical protein